MHLKGIAASLVLLVGASLAAADDVNPPWWRGEPRTTFAQWEFGTPDMLPPPDTFVNPFGPPTLDVDPAYYGWLPAHDGREGIWSISDLSVDIPNFPEPLETKFVWVQITWAPFPEEPYAFPTVVEELAPGGPYVAETYDRIEDGLWTHELFHIALSPNPERERLHISGDVFIDEVIIDTICIPEPAGVLMLSVALTALRPRRIG